MTSHTENDEIEIGLDWGLSHQEISLIGNIIVEWSFLESELFKQIAESSNNSELSEIEFKKKLKYQGFTKLVKLWENEIVENSSDPINEVLTKQLDEILYLMDFRNAIAHAMWEWHPDKIGTISSVRVKKDKIIQVALTSEDLVNISKRLRRVNFNIRYPNGKDQFYAELAENISETGGYTSRNFLLQIQAENSDAQQ